MNDNANNTLVNLLRKHHELGISNQIDYDKFYLYSIITHSTAIEGSTVTEVEAQLLFDEGITSSKHCEHLQYDIDQFELTTAERMVDKTKISQKMVDKWSITPSLADKLADIVEWMINKDEITTEQVVAHFGYADTTAKRYLRQLTSFGYLEQKGANRNRSYKLHFCKK